MTVSGGKLACGQWTKHEGSLNCYDGKGAPGAAGDSEHDSGERRAAAEEAENFKWGRDDYSGGYMSGALDDAAKAASMAPKPPPGLARQSTQAIQKANPNVRVTSQRESRYANPDAADDTPLSELLARRGSRFDDVEEEEAKGKEIKGKDRKSVV